MKKIRNRFIALIVMSLFMLINCSTVAFAEIDSSAETESSSTEDNYGKNEIVETESDEVLQESIEENLESTGNDYPIVFVHGLMGWGDDEMLGFHYWGGFNSLEDILNNSGYEVYMPTLGPVSSNWDRACELYAYLKGGTVDYGAAHSAKYGHSRYGKTYPGVLPQLGTYGEDGVVQKMHLFGHSMGGQTSRVLAQLLEEGSQEEMDATGSETSPLFTGGKHWIASITTLCTPHDGSSYAEFDNNYEPYVHQFFASIAATCGFSDINLIKFSLSLDQWGLSQEAGESFESYLDRVFNSKIWGQTTDLSIYDLTTQGSSEINNWATAKDDIYYFSIACSDTHRSLITGNQIPNINMDPLMLSSTYIIGSYTQSGQGKYTIDSSWWSNDGLVSVVSAVGPHLNSTDKIVDYDGSPEKGEWNYLGEIKNVDHLQVIFQDEPIYTWYLQNKYKSWCEMLSELNV